MPRRVLLGRSGQPAAYRLRHGEGRRHPPAQPAAARNDRRRTCRRRGRKRERPECIGLRGTAQRVPPRIVHEQSRPRRGDRRQNPHHGQLCGRRELPALRTAALRRHYPHRDRLPEIRHTAHAESVRRHARPHGLARRISLRPAAVAMGRRMPHGRGRPHRLARPLRRRSRRAAQPAARTDAVEEGTGRILRRRLHERLDDLGITSATVNVSPLQFMYLSPAKAGMVEHAYCGETYYFDTEKLDALDATLRETAARDITVAAILLVDPAAEARDAELGALLQHPDYTRGTYTMPNMTTPKAVRAYAAMIDFLAQRYCREDDAYGRIAHWIVHNEVDGGVDWTNMGDDKLVTTYTNAYVKSMRLCASIVRQYDANAEFFASFSHSWSRASNPGWYPVRDMVGLLGDFSRAEGDFRWALACHSYPETISDPCTWREPNATFAMNTPFVTLKNLEVLSKWALTPANLFRGTTRRSVWLSEAGTNSPTYAEADLRNQCAGFAYGWKKIAALPGIDGIQWHNWFDHRNEGTLRIGLRRYPDDAEDPGGKKPIWETYRDAGTDREEESFAPFLSVIGIPDWNILQPVAD
ncbi:DUF5722 domain-containing protein [Alistipes communis]|uniref:DUF5722 domain-containing protein n=1 Tax=Alistipes communis TaxID=2585118 RepID=UPI00346217F4